MLQHTHKIVKYRENTHQDELVLPQSGSDKNPVTMRKLMKCSHDQRYGFEDGAY